MNAIEQQPTQLNSTIERLMYYHRYTQAFYGYKGRNWLEKSLGLSIGYLTRALKRKSSIGSDLLPKIHKTFPKLNISWLVLGEGDMENC